MQATALYGCNFIINDHWWLTKTQYHGNYRLFDWIVQLMELWSFMKQLQKKARIIVKKLWHQNTLKDCSYQKVMGSSLSPNKPTTCKNTSLKMLSVDQIYVAVIKCDPCNKEGGIVEAIGFCKKCNKYYCKTCYRTHARNQVTKDHTLLDQTAMPRDSVLSGALFKPVEDMSGSRGGVCSIRLAD